MRSMLKEKMKKGRKKENIEIVMTIGESKDKFGTKAKCY